MAKKIVAVLVGPEFEDSELTKPVKRLEKSGYKVCYLGEKAGEKLKGKRGKAKVKVDSTAADAAPGGFVGVLIPGGHSPDHIRTVPALVRFLEAFHQTGRPIAAICHGPQMLIEADLVRGKRVTSWPSVRRDLQNAGALWEDSEVVVDGPLITSRNPDDIPAFTRAFLEKLDAGASAGAAPGEKGTAGTAEDTAAPAAR